MRLSLIVQKSKLLQRPTRSAAATDTQLQLGTTQCAIFTKRPSQRTMVEKCRRIRRTSYPSQVLLPKTWRYLSLQYVGSWKNRRRHVGYAVCSTGSSRRKSRTQRQRQTDALGSPRKYAKIKQIRITQSGGHNTFKTIDLPGYHDIGMEAYFEAKRAEAKEQLPEGADPSSYVIDIMDPNQECTKGHPFNVFMMPLPYNCRHWYPQNACRACVLRMSPVSPTSYPLSGLLKGPNIGTQVDYEGCQIDTLFHGF